MHKNVEIGEDKIFPFFMKHPNREWNESLSCDRSPRPGYLLPLVERNFAPLDSSSQKQSSVGLLTLDNAKLAKKVRLILTPTPSLLEMAYAVAMSRKGHFYFGLAFFLCFFSRIKYFQPGLLRISLRLSWWSSLLCRL